MHLNRSGHLGYPAGLVSYLQGTAGDGCNASRHDFFLTANRFRSPPPLMVVNESINRE